MKYSEIEKAYETLSLIQNKTFPRKIAVAIVRNMSILKPINELIERQKMDVLKKYCVCKEDGSPAFMTREDGSTYVNFIDNESGKQYYKELDEVLLIEEDINIVKINSSDLDVCDSDPRFSIITPAEELSIGFMIEYSE